MSIRSSNAGTTRLRPTALLLSALLLMTLACSLVPFGDTSASASASAAPSAPAASLHTAHAAPVDAAQEPGSGDEQTSHPCGIPQSQPSVTSSPLLGALNASPLLDLLEPPQANTSPRAGTEPLPVRHGEGLLTFLCVQRV